MMHYLKTSYKFNEAECSLLEHYLRLKHFTKGHDLVVPGQIQREMYFIKSGVQMSYFQAEEKLQVIAFTYPPNICAVPDSFPFQKPSKYFLTCLTDTECYSLSYDNLQEVFSASRSIERFFRVMTESVLAGIIDRHTELHTTTIEERYLVFCKRSPHLLQMVPHKYIASYLGINPTNFSKLYNSIKI